jgi:hypothetical protein
MKPWDKNYVRKGGIGYFTREMKVQAETVEEAFEAIRNLLIIKDRFEIEAVTGAGFNRELYPYDITKVQLAGTVEKKPYYNAIRVRVTKKNFKQLNADNEEFINI